MSRRAEDIVRHYLKKGILISPDMLSQIKEGKIDPAKVYSPDALVMHKGAIEAIGIGKEVDWKEFEKAKALYEKGRDRAVYERFMEYIGYEPEKGMAGAAAGGDDAKEGGGASTQGAEFGPVVIVKSYPEMRKKKAVKDFVSYYNSRYRQLSSILRQRSDLRNTTTIRRLAQRDVNEVVSVIGLVKEKRMTKNDNLLLTLEDPSGEVSVLVSKNKVSRQEGEERSQFDEAKDICNDEVIGVTGNLGEKGSIIFASAITWPEVPLAKEFRKSPEEEYAVFIGDIHVGSKYFMSKEFSRMISWLNGSVGSSEQKEQAKKTKYLFVVGDLVEGIGIYPNQENDLEIPDIYDQFRAFAEYMKQIPPHVSIIICPGNHDPVRVQEPQPPIGPKYTEELSKMPNVHLVSSPSIVNVGKKEGFPGFDVLLYHGFSFPFYADAIESIRQKGGLERVDLIIKYLLKRRHLAPEHGSTLYVPDYDEDPLVISSIPDIIATGHIHRATAMNYNNVTLLNCACWIPQTDYQEKRGLHPQPAKAVVLNLKSREIKILSFAK